MRKRFIVLFFAAVIFWYGLDLSSADGLDPRLQNVKAWAFAIGEHMLEGDVGARFAGYDLVIVDGEDAGTEQIAALKAQGTIVLAYLSVGTIEKWRWWYPLVKAFRLDYWGDWDEWYANTSKKGFRDVIVKRVAPWILNKGVDGLFLDNTDMIDSHPRQRGGMRTLVRRLAKRVVRPRGKLLFTQNGEDSIVPTLKYYDGWNREDVSWTYDFDSGEYREQPPEEIAYALAALMRIGAEGLLVTATDYTPDGDKEAENFCLENACAVGALSFVSDIGLSRLPEAPLLCSSQSGTRR